jgi:hypothetical protein
MSEYNKTVAEVLIATVNLGRGRVQRVHAEDIHVSVLRPCIGQWSNQAANWNKYSIVFNRERTLFRSQPSRISFPTICPSTVSLFGCEVLKRVHVQFTADKTVHETALPELQECEANVVLHGNYMPKSTIRKRCKNRHSSEGLNKCGKPWHRGILGWMSAGDPVGRVEQLEREVASLQRRLDRSLSENERLEQEIATHISGGTWTLRPMIGSTIGGEPLSSLWKRLVKMPCFPSLSHPEKPVGQFFASLLKGSSLKLNLAQCSELLVSSCQYVLSGIANADSRWCTGGNRAWAPKP